MGLREHMSATRKSCLLWILLLFRAFLNCDSYVTPSADYFGIFSESLHDVEFYKFVYDSSRNSIYVAATGKLYSLSNVLKEQSSTSFGPFPDNINCSFRPGDPCSHQRAPVSFIPRTLVIDKAHNILITCSAIYYGSCYRVDLPYFTPIGGGYIYKPVVPNDDAKSVTMFVGPGIKSDGVLYVGASYSSKGDARYRDLVNLITVRELQTFDIIQEKDYSSRLKMLPEFQETLPVEFVGGFDYNGYIYFFASHKNSLGTSTSYAMRICDKDARLRSFVELPLACSVAGVQYPILRDVVLGSMGSRLVDALKVTSSNAMFGVFVKSETDVAGAVCVYHMRKVEEAFEESVSNCFSGNGNLGPNYLIRPVKCNATSNVGNVQCGENSQNHPISSDSALQPVSAILLKNVVPTSIVTKTVYDNTVAYIGTKNGKILKLKIQDPSNLSVIYGTVNLDLDSVQEVKDLIVVFPETIYALTSKTVHGIKARNCAATANCNKCIIDPHCGWCIPNNRCTLKPACPSSTLWLTELCPNVMEVTPSNFSRDKYTSTLFMVKVNFLPSTLTEINCQMSNPLAATANPETVKAAVDGSPSNTNNRVVKCKAFSRYQVIPDRTVQLNLSLTILIDKLTWTKVSVMVYDCQQRHSCGNCTAISGLCKWCISQHKCLAAIDSSCDSQVQPSNIFNQNDCPRIEQDPTKKLLIPAGVAKDLQVIGYNIMALYRTLKCRFKLENQDKLFDASYVATSPSETFTPKATVTCKSVDLQYLDLTSSKLATIDLVWESNYALDRPANLTVNVYKCQYLELSCGRCLLLDPEFNCIWCEDGKQCIQNNDCVGKKITQDQICPNPQITSLIPAGGPLGGGTALTINGVNLGKVSGDVNVEVGGVSCPTIPEKCRPPDSIVCKTAAKNHPGNADVIVTVNQQHKTPPFAYIYKNPSFKSATPMKGPCAGGTHVVMTGENLDYGSDVTVSFFKANSRILRRNSTHLELLTPYHNKAESTGIMAKFDGGAETRTLSTAFLCVEDVEVNTIVPLVAFISGGNIINVTGSNFDYIQRPQLILYIDSNVNVTVPCQPFQGSRNLLQCRSPDLRFIGLSVHDQIGFNFGFVMDNVTELLQLQSKQRRKKRAVTFRSFTYYADPQITRFPKPIKYKKGDVIKIQGAKGDRIDRLTEFKDASVKFGGTPGSSLSSPYAGLLTVIPPEKPQTLTKDGNAVVSISLGNYNEEVGEVSYKETTTTTTPVGLIIGLVLGILFIIIIIVGVLVWFFVMRKKKFVRRPSSSLRAIDGQVQRASSNPYLENGRNTQETTPLRRMEGRNDQDYEASNEAANIQNDEQFLQFLLRRIENSRIRAAAREVYIARERLELGNILGSGHFGRVYAATLRDNNMRNPKSVAVKTIEDTDLDHRVIEKFLQEGIVMKNFNHPHVLSLIGLCLGYKKEPMVILPFMANGDLRAFVKDQSKDFTARQLLLLAQQVAEGMSYLSSLNFIHRDLAARNCMIDENHQVRVADFGLSHQLHDREYYRNTDHKARLPVKWMALESLEDFIFTTKSDVWSYGVLMWELMTRGIVPYPDVDAFEIRNYLATGHRLRQPKYCPDAVYGIMTDCWQALPEARPTFTDLVNRIELLLTPSQKRASGDGGMDEPSYLNIVESSNQDYLKPVVYEPPAIND